MVSFNPGSPKYEDLNREDKFRVDIGRVLCDAMQCAIEMQRHPKYLEKSKSEQAEVMASLTIHFVSAVTDIIENYGRQFEEGSK